MRHFLLIISFAVESSVVMTNSEVVNVTTISTDTIIQNVPSTRVQSNLSSTASMPPHSQVTTTTLKQTYSTQILQNVTSLVQSNISSTTTLKQTYSTQILQNV